MRSEFKVGQTVLYIMGPNRMVPAIINIIGNRTWHGKPTTTFYYAIRPFHENGKPMKPRTVAGYSIRAQNRVTKPLPEPPS